MTVVRQGGYEEGYRSSRCFWGTNPSSLVLRLKEFNLELNQLRVLDLGCGEGKNAAFLAEAGCIVDAVDCSKQAIQNGQAAFGFKHIRWIETDAIRFFSDNSSECDGYDIIICYGLFHCLRSESEISRLIGLIDRSLQPGNIFVVCCFNSRSHDLSAHPGFKPTLMSHSWYSNALSNFKVLFSSDEDLFETHPHNEIPHHHSMTRMILEKR